jgi:hypothetical protein
MKNIILITAIFLSLISGSFSPTASMVSDEFKQTDIKNLTASINLTHHSKNEKKRELKEVRCPRNT